MRVILISTLVIALALGGIACAQTNPQAVSTAFGQCLSGNSISLPAAPPGQVPPGLAVGLQNLQVMNFSGGDGVGYAYEANLGSGHVCGVALYGTVNPAVRQQIVDMIERRRPALKPAPDKFWSITAPVAHKTYWGDIMAPGLSGVRVLDRPPSSAAPSLDAQYHVALVR